MLPIVFIIFALANTLPRALPLAPPHLPLPPHNPAVPPHQILLPVAPRHVPLLARNAQLLARLPRRPTGQPTGAYPPAVIVVVPRQPPRADYDPAHPAAAARQPARRGPSRLQCLGPGSCARAAGGGLWLGCLGHEYPGRRLVRLVAGVACWRRAAVWPAGG